MLRFPFPTRSLNLKIILLMILGLSFAGGLGLARHLYPSPALAPLAQLSRRISTSHPADQGDPVPHHLFNAFTASGARLATVRLEAWGSLNRTFLSGEALRELASRATAALGLAPDLGFTSQDSAGFHALNWEGQLRPGEILYLSLQSLVGPEGSGESYLLINLEGTSVEGEGWMQAWQEKVRAAFRPWQVEPHLTYGLIGVIPGQLSPPERQQRVQAVLAALQAQRVEGVEDEGLISISAYSSLLPRRLEVAGRPVNVNVALRYHATDGNTYLYLGSPLLGGEY
ncbi:MAG: hypothetical protein PWQ18_1039 [Clostridia bacterium]|nr:hypothetical protein [Clostridia bacterium]